MLQRIYEKKLSEANPVSSVHLICFFQRSVHLFIYLQDTNEINRQLKEMFA